MLPTETGPRKTGSSRRRAVTASAALIMFGMALAADQASKGWALSALSDGSAIPVLPTVFFRLVFNSGVAFGMGSAIGPLIAVAISVVLVALVYWIGWLVIHRRSLSKILLLSVVAGGGTGNMLDRIFRAENGPLSGHVVDFIAVDWFAIFNLGDVFAVGGVIAWMILTVLSRHRPLPASSTYPISDTVDRH